MFCRFLTCAVGIVSLVGLPVAARAGCLDPCLSTATSAGGVLLVCPAGDGPTLASVGATIHVRVADNAGTPVPGIPASDFWIVPGTSAFPRLCGSFRSANADHATDANGETTISGTVAAGGLLGTDHYVCAQGYVLLGFDQCRQSLPVRFVSPDIDGDLAVDATDFARFGTMYPPSPYDARADMNGDAVINATDFARFAMHVGHACGN